MRIKQILFQNIDKRTDLGMIYSVRTGKGEDMKQSDDFQFERAPEQMEENLKKALTEMLALQLFSEEERYIGELPELIEARSRGDLTIVFPYAAFYRLYKAGLITEKKKRSAPDGRLRQYYAITDKGREYLSSLFVIYKRVIRAAERVVHPEQEQGGKDE